MANSELLLAFSNLGNSWLVSEDLLRKLEKFLWALYGKCLQNFDLCYQLYCSKGEEAEPEALPPRKSTLALHVTMTNYQAGVWRRPFSEFQMSHSLIVMTGRSVRILLQSNG